MGHPECVCVCVYLRGGGVIAYPTPAQGNTKQKKRKHLFGLCLEIKPKSASVGVAP
jgi:hypothetical protein